MMLKVLTKDIVFLQSHNAGVSLPSLYSSCLPYAPRKSNSTNFEMNQHSDRIHKSLFARQLCDIRLSVSRRGRLLFGPSDAIANHLSQTLVVPNP